MSRSPRKYRWFIPVILVTIGILSYFSYKYFSPITRKSSDIFITAPATLRYGETTIVGTLRKDAPIGQDGQYIIVLPDAQPILIEAVGLDNLLGLSVIASGYLRPASSTEPMKMSVNSIEVSAQ